MKPNSILLVVLSAVFILVTCKKEPEFEKPILKLLSEQNVSGQRGDTIEIELHLTAEAGIQSLMLNEQVIDEIDETINDQTFIYNYFVENDTENGQIALVFLLIDQVGNEVKQSIFLNIENKDEPLIYLSSNLETSYYKFDTVSFTLHINCPEGLDFLKITDQNNNEVYSYSSSDNVSRDSISFSDEIPFDVSPSDSGLIFKCIAVDVVGQSSAQLSIPINISERESEVNFFKSSGTKDDIDLQVIIEDNANNIDIYGYGLFQDVGGELVPSAITSIFICNDDSDEGVMLLYGENGVPKYFYIYNRQTKTKGTVLAEMVFLEAESYIICYDYDWETQNGIFNSTYAFEDDPEGISLYQTSISQTELKSLPLVKQFISQSSLLKSGILGPCGIFDVHCENSPLNWATTINASEWRSMGKKMIGGAALTSALSGGTATPIAATVAFVGLVSIGIAEIIDYANEAILSEKKSLLESDFCSRLRSPEQAPREASIPNDNKGFTPSDISESKLGSDPCTGVNIAISASMDIEGSILVISSGGIQPHQYSVESSGWQGSQVFPNAYSNGSYLIGAIDVNGCSNYVNIALIKTDPCASTDLAIGVESDGPSIIISATGGSPPYSYSINNNSWSSSSTFNNVPPGENTVSVMDEDGCVRSTIITMDDYCSSLELSLAPKGTEIEASATGGTTPYLYSINGSAFSSGNIFEDLEEGSHQVCVKDATDCQICKSVKLENLYCTFILDGKTYSFSSTRLSKKSLFDDGVWKSVSHLISSTYNSSDDVWDILSLYIYTVPVTTTSYPITIYYSDNVQCSLDVSNCVNSDCNGTDNTLCFTEGSFLVQKMDAEKNIMEATFYAKQQYKDPDTGEIKYHVLTNGVIRATIKEPYFPE